VCCWGDVYLVEGLVSHWCLSKSSAWILRLPSSSKNFSGKGLISCVGLIVSSGRSYALLRRPALLRIFLRCSDDLWSSMSDLSAGFIRFSLSHSIFSWRILMLYGMRLRISTSLWVLAWASFWASFGFLQGFLFLYLAVILLHVLRGCW